MLAQHSRGWHVKQGGKRANIGVASALFFLYKVLRQLVESVALALLHHVSIVSSLSHLERLRHFRKTVVLLI